MKRFLLVFAVVALVLAGGVAYLADADPDGLEAATREGCTVVATSDGERLRGDCIAKQAREHALADSPLAGYTVAGREGLTGVAGVAGVVATAVLAGGLFWVLRRRDRPRPPEA